MILIRIMDFFSPLKAASRHFGIMLLSDDVVVERVLYIGVLTSVQLKF